MTHVLATAVSFAQRTRMIVKCEVSSAPAAAANRKPGGFGRMYGPAVRDHRAGSPLRPGELTDYSDVYSSGLSWTSDSAGVSEKVPSHAFAIIRRYASAVSGT